LTRPEVGEFAWPTGDNGAVMSEYFPLSMKLKSSVDDPRKVEGIEDSLSVDTSDWYENYLDHDEEQAPEQNEPKVDVEDF
jgi:hypothetical protein